MSANKLWWHVKWFASRRLHYYAIVLALILFTWELHKLARHKLSDPFIGYGSWGWGCRIFDLPVALGLLVLLAALLRYGLDQTVQRYQRVQRWGTSLGTAVVVVGVIAVGLVGFRGYLKASDIPAMRQQQISAQNMATAGDPPRTPGSSTRPATVDSKHNVKRTGFSGDNTIGNRQSSVDASDFIAHTQSLLTLFGVLLTVAALGATFVGVWLQSRLNALSTLDKQIDEVSKLAAVAAESALASLPPPSETQQIPDGILRTLRVMDRLIFGDPDRALLSYLDKQQNGARLHLAKAVLEYGRGNFHSAAQEVSMTMDRARTDNEIRHHAGWLRAIIMRQMGDYDTSIEELRVLLADAEARGDQVLRSQLLVGMACSCLAQKRRG